MNWNKLFETQRLLDASIIEKKGLQGRDLLPEKILALQVELGECANEWRGFKFWSENQEPRVEEWIECSNCDGTGDLNYEMVQEDAEGSGGHEYIDCEECDCAGTAGTRNPLLEEYVDCLHFILSIGNCFRNIEYLTIEPIKHQDITRQFNELFGSVYALQPSWDIYGEVVNEFIGLGELLGFTWNQIEQAYYDKNEINHSRQESGY